MFYCMVTSDMNPSIYQSSFQAAALWLQHVSISWPVVVDIEGGSDCRRIMPSGASRLPKSRTVRRWASRQDGHIHCICRVFEECIGYILSIYSTCVGRWSEDGRDWQMFPETKCPVL